MCGKIKRLKYQLIKCWGQPTSTKTPGSHVLSRLNHSKKVTNG